ncbi:hypothetical protein B0H14DRAFT_3461947 [Mycena olivaceomarginata]|nr:hypothetical protein B0H14DRAFT_3461947 [Mycena olivaceomarginata]
MISLPYITIHNPTVTLHLLPPRHFTPPLPTTMPAIKPQYCEEAFRTPREIVEHNLRHRGQRAALKPSTRPSAPQQLLPPPELGQNFPTWALPGPAVQILGIPKDRRKTLSAWDWNSLLRASSQWLWRRCKRTIPPAEELYPLVSAVFKTFGHHKDNKSGLALFNASAWAVAKNVLELIQKGFLSDPPGIPLYYQLGVDKSALPLPVGTYNSTGKRYKGHYSIWQTNERGELLVFLEDVLMDAQFIAGWVNGNLYQPTDEVAGVLRIPEDVRIKYGMAQFEPSIDSARPHHHFAGLQGTRKAILPVHNHDEKDLFLQLRATANGRGKTSAHVVTWSDFKNFSIKAIAERYWVKLSLPMFLSKYMSAPKVKGVFIERKRRPYPMIQVAAISSFILAQNPYANDDMAMLLGIWHFVCKSHVDVTRVYCRFGNTVADTTARAALKSMTDASIAEMKAVTEAANTRSVVEHCIVLDNVQEHDGLWDQGIGRVSRTKVGTVGTRIKMHGCAAKGFDAPDYYARVARKERKNLTVRSLFDDIDWEHELQTQRLHWARVLIDFASPLHPLQTLVMALFRSDCETSFQGMLRAVEDFDNQFGVDPKKYPGLLEWKRPVPITRIPFPLVAPGSRAEALVQ